MRTRLSAALLVLVALSISGGVFAEEPSGPAPEATATAAVAATPVITVAPSLTPAANLDAAAVKTRFEMSVVFAHDTHATNVAGIRTTTTPAGWRVGVAADLYRQTGTRYYAGFSGAGPNVGEISDMLELDLGGRLSFTEQGAIRPWLGSGAGAFNVEGKMIPGLWVGAGIDVIVAKKIDLGLLLHYSTAHSPDFPDGGRGGVELGSTTIGGSAGLVF